MNARAVYKYSISLGNGVVTEAAVSGNNLMLSVGFDPSGEPCVWVEVNADEHPTEYKPVRFVSYYTGTRILDEKLHFAGMLIQGSLVYHIYTDGTVTR